MGTTRIHQSEPCPFCGNTETSMQQSLLKYRVMCNSCQAFGSRCRSFHQALAQWEHQSRELRLEKSIENRLLLEHLSNFGHLPPPALPIAAPAHTQPQSPTAHSGSGLNN